MIDDLRVDELGRATAPNCGVAILTSQPERGCARDEVRELLAAVAAVLDDAEMTRRSDARSHRRNWTTVAVIPCPPGWRIVYDIRDAPRR